jgi:hypothetical protein
MQIKSTNVNTLRKVHTQKRQNECEAFTFSLTFTFLNVILQKFPEIALQDLNKCAFSRRIYCLNSYYLYSKIRLKSPQTHPNRGFSRVGLRKGTLKRINIT